MDRMKTSKGRAAYWIIAVIIILLVAGFGGYKVYNHFLKAKQTPPIVISNPNAVVSPNPSPANSTQSAGTNSSGLADAVQIIHNLIRMCKISRAA